MSQPLYDPTIERDACGIGLVADARGRASRELVDRALAGLAAVSHRGAWAADGVTGDGAGVLLPLHPSLTGIDGAGLAMCFLREPWLRGIVEEACRAEGLEPFGWRDVPIDVAALGSTATASMPRIAQLVLAPCAEPDAELRAHRARRRAERVDGVYVASLSFRTVTYKALCAATQLETFYPDLADTDWTASWAIFHQRFSTNTDPSWERAQPFRFLCHNGEINTIEGNVAWMEARERARGLDAELAPALDRTGSDSALLDNALELLVRAGLDVREAVTLLVPPAWQNDPRIDERERAMHRYHAMLAEPWDGPAGLVFGDGVVCGAALDRNGLRPLRVAVCEDGLVAVSSEAGAIPLPEGVAVRRARLGPGQLLSLDPDRGLLFDGELKRVLASRKPYSAWVDESVRYADQGTPLPAPDGDLGSRHALHGYTREDLSLMLRPIAQTGADPVYSMGDDAPIAPLAGRGRPLASYFRQRFAQVTNPAIDHYRERTVMSVATLVGARAPLDAEGPLPPLTVLPTFLVTPNGLAALAPDDIDATFTADEGLAAAVERLADRAVALAESGSTAVCLTDAAAGGDRAAVPTLLARRRGPRPARRAGAADDVLAPRGERRDTGHAHGGDAGRLRRRRRLPAARARDRGAARRHRQGRRRPADARRGTGTPARLARGRRAEGDVEDGHLGRGELPGRAALRGGRPRPAPLPAVLRRDAVGDRRDLARRAGAGRARPARRAARPRSPRSRIPASTSSAREGSRTPRIRTSSRRSRRA